MFINGLGTASPPHRYTQAQCWEVLQTSDRFWRLQDRSRAVLRKVLTGENGIATRHLVLERLEDAFDLNADALHARFRGYRRVTNWISAVLPWILRGWLHRLPRRRPYAFGFQNCLNKLGFRIAVGITITLVLVG